ncbi:hypothetical protein BC832DRAFT_540985 [Gaertneriomyces semiglobifer]|nr:hypothetical protein BC832DRAFT_540985 [Gaertneriomyces semiglobifer]
MPLKTADSMKFFRKAAEAVGSRNSEACYNRFVRHWKPKLYSMLPPEWITYLTQGRDLNSSQREAVAKALRSLASNVAADIEARIRHAQAESVAVPSILSDFPPLSDDEKERLQRLFDVYGGRWALIQREFPTRSCHFLRTQYLKLIENDQPWQVDEDRLLIKGKEEFEETGYHWVKTRDNYLPHRTTDQLSHRYRKTNKSSLMVYASTALISIPYAESYYLIDHRSLSNYATYTTSGRCSQTSLVRKIGKPWKWHWRRLVPNGPIFVKSIFRNFQPMVYGVNGRVRCRGRRDLHHKSGIYLYD